MSTDAEELARITPALKALFPDAGPVAPVRVLSSGFRSLAVETASGAIFRVGKVPEAAAGYEREARLLPVLRGLLPVAVPQPRWHAGPCASFPFGVLGHSKLPGRPLDPADLSPLPQQRLADQLGEFLVALHRVSVTDSMALAVTHDMPERAARARWQDDVLSPLRSSLPATDYSTITRWWESFVTDRRMLDYRPVLRHGDLWYENILVDVATWTVVGVIDFECAAFGDPAQDFATQFHLGEHFARQVMGAYRTAGGDIDADMIYRTRRLWELREFDGLRAAARRGDWTEFADGVRKLRHGPILAT